MRLPDDLVVYIDGLISASGDSRASVVVRALRLYRQQQVAETDARILEATGDYDDFAALTSRYSIGD